MGNVLNAFVGQQQRDLEKLRNRQHKGMRSETTDVTVPDAVLGRLEAKSHTYAVFIRLPHMSPADLHQHKPEKAAWHQTQTCETEQCVACGWATKLLHGGDRTICQMNT